MTLAASELVEHNYIKLVALISLILLHPRKQAGEGPMNPSRPSSKRCRIQRPSLPSGDEVTMATRARCQRSASVHSALVCLVPDDATRWRLSWCRGCCVRRRLLSYCSCCLHVFSFLFGCKIFFSSGRRYDGECYVVSYAWNAHGQRLVDYKCVPLLRSVIVRNYLCYWANNWIEAFLMKQLITVQHLVKLSN